MSEFLLPAADAPEGFPFPEKIARLKAGLSEEDVRELRMRLLKRDVDFVYHKKAVFLSAAALEKIAPGLCGPAPEKAQDAAIAAEAAPIAPVTKLLIVRADLANRHLLLACLANEDPDHPKATVRVRVRSTDGFRKRAAIEAQIVPGYDDLFDLVGKYPRKKESQRDVPI